MGRHQLDELAQRVEGSATWDDLVLPDAQLAQLRELLARARRQVTVEHERGWARRGRPGPMAAVLAGPSGTSKTLTAQVLAGALELDVYRIDLGALVSKHLSETERNLREVLDAAEARGAILLFDEADALFGRRTDVRDSHDRFTNVKADALAEQLKTFHGLVLLETSHADLLDDALLRHVAFVIDFPSPGPGVRDHRGDTSP